MNFINRDIKKELLAMAKSYPVVTLIGPRQSGKTTLVQTLFPKKDYISLENPDDRNFAELDPRGFFDNFPKGAVIDEIQRVPQLLSYIQGIVDKNQMKGQFILTGSHQLSLHQSITQSLAGRTAILTLLPLCISELPAVLQNASLDHLLYHGMYPRVYADNLEPTKFYRNYLQTYVERDVRQMIQLKDLSAFQKFIKLCAARVGQLFNATNISNEVGVSSATIAHWLSILEASFIIFRLQPYFENFGKRMIKSPKLYFTDVGLAAYCLDIHNIKQLARDPLRGNLVENFVVSEFLKHQVNVGLGVSSYFYRDSNHNEVDLIIKNGHQLIPIEIKSSKTFHPEFLKNLIHFQSLVKDRCPFGYLIYAGDREQKIGDIHVAHFSHSKQIIEEIFR